MKDVEMILAFNTGRILGTLHNDQLTPEEKLKTIEEIAVESWLKASGKSEDTDSMEGD